MALQTRRCSFEGCDRPFACKGFCNAHAAQMRRTGRVWPLFQETSIVERILARSTHDHECLLWQGERMKNGYGAISWRNTKWLVHRAIWTAQRGDIPEDLTVDHLCRRRNCVNVEHLEVVTRVENSRRGGGLEVAWAKRRAKDRCKQGHPLSGDNLRIDKNGGRLCRECGRQSWRRWAARKKAQSATSGDAA